MIHFMSSQSQITDSFDVMELTQEEEALVLDEAGRHSFNGLTAETRDEVLSFALGVKRGFVNELLYWRKVNNPPAYVKPTVEVLKEAVIKRMCSEIPVFRIDDDNREIFHTLCLYFTDDPRFEQRGDGYSLKKGISIMGPVGCGKSTLIRAFTSNPKASYFFVSSRKVTYEFAIDGFKVVERYSAIERSAPDAHGHKEYGTAFDDLGTDEERKHYGDKVNVMADIILNRYDNVPHHLTHFTTNLTAPQIEDIYGARVRSRMREMFNLISFHPTAVDRRK